MSRKVLSFHYVLTNQAGETVDSSRQGEPFHVMEGAQQIIVGLEEELFKMSVGDKKRVEVPAAKAYGVINDRLKITVGRQKLPKGDIKVGMQFAAGPDQGAPVFTVTQVDEAEVCLDGNHPLAGQDLTFDVEIMGIREATEEEIHHGHAHGPEGHHHH